MKAAASNRAAAYSTAAATPRWTPIGRTQLVALRSEIAKAGLPMLRVRDWIKRAFDANGLDELDDSQAEAVAQRIPIWKDKMRKEQEASAATKDTSAEPIRLDAWTSADWLDDYATAEEREWATRKHIQEALAKQAK